MKLFVDDERDAYDETWVTVRSVTSAIRHISRMPFITEISLDHDIGHMGEDIMEPAYACNETFDAVAIYMKEMYSKQPPSVRPRVIVHSANPVGALRIKEILGEDFTVEIKPYS